MLHYWLYVRGPAKNCAFGKAAGLSVTEGKQLTSLYRQET